MIAVLDRPDLDFLAEKVWEFEEEHGEVDDGFNRDVVCGCPSGCWTACVAWCGGQCTHTNYN